MIKLIGQQLEESNEFKHLVSILCRYQSMEGKMTKSSTGKDNGRIIMAYDERSDRKDSEHVSKNRHFKIV